MTNLQKQAESFRLLYKGILENFESIRQIFNALWYYFKHPYSGSRSSSSLPSSSGRRHASSSNSNGASFQICLSQSSLQSPFHSAILMQKCFQRLKLLFEVQHLDDEYINAASILFQHKQSCTVFLGLEYLGARKYSLAEMEKVMKIIFSFNIDEICFNF